MSGWVFGEGEEHQQLVWLVELQLVQEASLQRYMETLFSPSGSVQLPKKVALRLKYWITGVALTNVLLGKVLVTKKKNLVSLVFAWKLSAQLTDQLWLAPEVKETLKVVMVLLLTEELVWLKAEFKVRLQFRTAS